MTPPERTGTLGVQPVAPKASWWTVPMDRAAFTERAREEQARMAAVPDRRILAPIVSWKGEP